MPTTVIRILCSGIMAASVCAGTARADQQNHDGNKSPPQPAGASAPAPHAGQSAAKVTSFSRDVCVKHPNLKQCS